MILPLYVSVADDHKFLLCCIQLTDESSSRLLLQSTTASQYGQAVK